MHYLFHGLVSSYTSRQYHLAQGPSTICCNHTQDSYDIVCTSPALFLDRINLTVPKGHKEAIQAHAEAHGESITAFINRAINETIERDKHIDEMKQMLQENADKEGVIIEDIDLEAKIVSLVDTLVPFMPEIKKLHFKGF